jgi:ferredoxin
MASPLSLWADAIFPCDQQDQPQTHHVVIEESTFTEMAAHDGHASEQQANSHHNNSSGSDSSATDCVCCGGCVTACASSACAVSAIGTESLGSMFDNQGPNISAADSFHSDPDPDSLFRPPNPNT